MRIIAKSTIRNYWLKNPHAEFALLDWYNTVKQCDWERPNDVKETFGNASIAANDRVVFNLKGNDYILIVEIDFDNKLVFIIWIGSHKEYDKINVSKIDFDENY